MKLADSNDLAVVVEGDALALVAAPGGVGDVSDMFDGLLNDDVEEDEDVDEDEESDMATGDVDRESGVGEGNPRATLLEGVQSVWMAR